jgi:hypothetical protein
VTGGHVDARAPARDLRRYAGEHAGAGDADVIRPARGAARAAVFRIGRRIHAGPQA